MPVPPSFEKDCAWVLFVTLSTRTPPNRLLQLASPVALVCALCLCVQYVPNPDCGVTLAGSLHCAHLRTGTSAVVQHVRARKRKEKTAATAARRISSSQPCSPPQSLCTTACVRVGCSFRHQPAVRHASGPPRCWSRPAFRAARTVGTRGLRRSLDLRIHLDQWSRRSLKARGFHRDVFRLQSSSLAPFASMQA